jgi:hypothetical protein
MNGYQQLQQISNELTQIGDWMQAENKKCSSLDDARALFREANSKLAKLHAKFKAVKLTPSERFQTGLLNKCIRKFIESTKAGSVGRFEIAERLAIEAQMLAIRFSEVRRP